MINYFFAASSRLHLTNSLIGTVVSSFILRSTSLSVIWSIMYCFVNSLSFLDILSHCWDTQDSFCSVGEEMCVLSPSSMVQGRRCHRQHKVTFELRLDDLWTSIRNTCNNGEWIFPSLFHVIILGYSFTGQVHSSVGHNWGSGCWQGIQTGFAAGISR